MKEPTTSISADINQIPGPRRTAVMGHGNQPLTRNRFRFLKVLGVLGCTFATTALFGQSSYIWTNQNPTHLSNGDLNQGTNWIVNGALGANFDAGGVPRPDFQDGVTWGDEMLFDGRTTGPLAVTQNGGAQANGGGSGQPYGLRIHLSGNQTAPVTIYSPVGTSGGMRMNYFTVDAGSGGLNIGNQNGANVLDLVGGVLNGQVFGFTNNSSVPCVLNADVRFRMGGAGAHAHVFAGNDWIVNNHMRSANSSAILVQKEGPGTMTWTGTNVGLRSANWFDNVGTPIRINGGTMILKSSDLVGTDAGGPAIVHNGALLKYDVQNVPGIATGPETIPGTISGSGPIQINAGTLTLAGASTFTGNINLTGGELIAGSTENVGVSGPLGQGGIISFNGGTFGWNLANAFDYSSRFDTSANQVYKLDTGGASPTLATGLSSSGGSLTKLGGGTLTLAGNSTYTGPTVINGGTLTFQGTKSGNANISVADGVALGIFENDSQVTPNTLTLGTSTGATLEFNNVTNHTTATLAPNTLATVGPVTISVNSGRFRLIGEVFPLLKWSSGPAPAVTLGFLAGAGGHLVTNVNGVQIDLVIDDPPYIWTDLAADNNWNLTSIDWQYSGANVAWVNGHYALLDDTAGGNGSVTLVGSIMPTNATINNSALTYAISSTPGNGIGGAGSLTKSGNGTLTLPGGANTYTGPTTLGGGVLGVTALANGGSASDIGAATTDAANIVFNGGTLQYTGPGVSINRLFSVGPGGGTIDNESSAALVFNNSGSLGMSGNGPRTLTLTGPGTLGDTIASGIVNHPAGTSLKKTGVGTWILTGTNTYAGGTTLLEGTLQIGVGSSSGTIGNGNISTASGTGIDFQRTGTLTVPGAISGGTGVTNDGSGVVILANDNTYTGGTMINAGTLQVGNGGGSGSLNTAGPIVNNSLLVFNTAGSFSYGSGANGIISGTGNVIVQGGGFIKAIGNNSYTGWTRIDANTTFQPVEGQDGGMATSAITNNGTLRLVRQDALITYAGPIVGTGRVQIGGNNVNVGVITFTGTNSYTGGTFIGDNTLVLGDASNPGYGTITGNVQFVNNFTIAQDNTRTLTFNRPIGDDFTFSGTITTNFASPQGNLGIVQLNGGANVTLTGNNTYGGGTLVNSGALIIGNGGSSGSVGFGPVTLSSGNPLLINRSGTLAILGNISGGSGVVTLGSASVTLGGSNTYTGPTIVSNGTVIVTTGAVGGDLNLEGGTFVAGGTNAAIASSVAGNLTIDSGTLVATLNKTAAQSNTFFQVGGTITRTGGTLKLFSAGPVPGVGEKYTLFSQPVTGGAGMTIVSPGFTVQNNLAVDGSVTVTAAQPLPALTSGITGNQLNLSWPASWTGGVHLQGQTNSVTIGISNNWVNIPGTELGNTFSTGVTGGNRAAFFRLVVP